MKVAKPSHMTSPAWPVHITPHRVYNQQLVKHSQHFLHIQFHSQIHRNAGRSRCWIGSWASCASCGLLWRCELSLTLLWRNYTIADIGGM